MSVDIEGWSVDILLVLFDGAIVVEVQGIVPQNSDVGLGLIIPAGHQEIGPPFDQIFHVSRGIGPLVAVSKRRRAPSKISHLQLASLVKHSNRFLKQHSIVMHEDLSFVAYLLMKARFGRQGRSAR